MTPAGISWAETNDRFRGIMEGDHARAEVQGGREVGRMGEREAGETGGMKAGRLEGWEEPGKDFPPPWKRPLL